MGRLRVKEMLILIMVNFSLSLPIPSTPLKISSYKYLPIKRTFMITLFYYTLSTTYVIRFDHKTGGWEGIYCNQWINARIRGFGKWLQPHILCIFFNSTDPHLFDEHVLCGIDMQACTCGFWINTTFSIWI